MSQTVIQPRLAPEADTNFDVELRKVFKVFNGDPAVRGIDLNIGQGEFFSILGPSGCGKTTTLRLIAGFDEPTAGEVIIRGRSMTHVPAYRRPVNTVFQSYALFGHMTVWDNIAFGLRIKGQTKAQVQDQVRDALRLVKMENFAKRYPAQLSGGQQQRVALARALVNRPTVVLLDEPLGALDLKLRKEMQVELSNLHRELGVTFVMVTHDQEEALSLSDRIAVMHEGLIEQIGSPHQIYEYPQTAFVADFIGDTNLFQGQVEVGDRSLLQITTETGLRIVAKPLETSKSPERLPDSQRVVVSVRPEKIHVSLDAPAATTNCFEGRLKHVMYMGTHVHYVVDLNSGESVTVMQPKLESVPETNTPIFIHWNPIDCLAIAT